jgi:GNAT superfamily N-acetyltransferase
MSLDVRRAGASERGELAKLLVAQMVEHDLPAEASRIERGLDVAFAPDSPAWLFVARRDGVAVGVMLAQRCASVEKGGLSVWIEELYVVPEARRSGVARALVQHLVDAAPRLGVVALDLEVVKTQAAALALYPALGFKRVDRLRFTRDL